MGESIWHTLQDWYCNSVLKNFQKPKIVIYWALFWWLQWSGLCNVQDALKLLIAKAKIKSGIKIILYRGLSMLIFGERGWCLWQCRQCHRNIVEELIVKWTHKTNTTKTKTTDDNGGGIQPIPTPINFIFTSLFEFSECKVIVYYLLG